MQRTVSGTSLPETLSEPSENVSTHAAAPEQKPDMSHGKDMPNGDPIATASSISPPTEQESENPAESVNSDSVESLIRKLKGTRHNLLRTTTYYSGMKVSRVHRELVYS